MKADDSTVTMFDLKTLAVIRQIQTHTGGLDGIMYDASADRIPNTGRRRRPTRTRRRDGAGAAGAVARADRSSRAGSW